MTKDQKKLDHLREKPFAQRMGFAGKTPWDFIQLLLIPLVLLIIGSLLSYQQNQTSLQAAADQQRETTLKTGLDDIKDLLLNKGLRASKPDDSVRVVARAEVLSTLRQLDGGRKETLMRFLSEAGLITRSRNGVIIDLSSANLRSADLSYADLSYADLSDADLSGADLIGANLNGAHLNVADLSGANLRLAKLSGADLGSADLSDADLLGANLHGADLSFANLKAAKGITEEELEKQAKSLKGATMPDGSKHP